MGYSQCCKNSFNCNNNKFQKVEKKVQGPPGPKGPPGTPAPPTYYALYSTSSRINQGDQIPVIKIFEGGNIISLVDSTNIKLTSGYIYFVSYIISATVEVNSYIQIIPNINNIPYIFYDATDVANTASNGNATVSGGFITNAASTSDANLSFNIYSSTASNISLSGSISIFSIPLIED